MHRQIKRIVFPSLWSRWWPSSCYARRLSWTLSPKVAATDIGTAVAKTTVA